MATYRVNLWGSKPGENDDCWTGDDFACREEAILAYREVVMFPDHSKLAKVCGSRGAWEYVMLDGPDAHELVPDHDEHAAVKAAGVAEGSRPVFPHTV